MASEDKRRYFTVCSVILEVVTPVFLNRIERDYTCKGFTSLQDFLNTQTVIHTLFHLRHKKARCCADKQNCHNHPSLPLIFCQWKLLYSEKLGPAHRDCHCNFTATPVQLEDLDITLSSLILLNCCVLTPDEEAAVHSLRQYKNEYLSHNTTGKISQTNYNKLWTDLTNFVLQLDSSKKDDLIRIEKRPLDEVLCNSYTLNLLDIHEKFNEMYTSIQGIRSDIQGQKAYMQEILQCTRKNGCTCHACRNGNFELENKDQITIKPYTLGQDVFNLSHQIKLRSEIPDDYIGFVTDMGFMNDGRLVICLPYQFKLLICNTDGSQVDSIHVKGQPWRVTAVNNSTVAITLMNDKCIDMYDTRHKLKIKRISVPGSWWGNNITTMNDQLVSSGNNNKLLIIDHQKEEVKQTIQTDCNPCELHVSGDRIFYCSGYSNNKKLYWYSYADHKHHNLILPSEPERMTSLEDSSLYVACKDGSVQHVSSDGKQYKTVTTKDLTTLCLLAYIQKQRKLVTSTEHYGIFNVFYEK